MPYTREVRHFSLASLLLTALLLVASTEARSQTRPDPPDPCVTGDCDSDAEAPYTKVGARLQMLRTVVESDGLDSTFFAGDTRPAGVGADSAGASLRFTEQLDADEIEAVERLGVRFRRDSDGNLSRVGAIYLADVDWSALDKLAAHPKLLRAESTWAPQIETPLDITSRKVGASVARKRPNYRLAGEGILFGDIDSGFDIFHPHLFRADGDWYAWVDVDQDDDFDPGTDGVDLDGDGSIDSEETLAVLDATVVSTRGRKNADNRLQADKDWLYVDVNGDGKRNVGTDEGFVERDPAYGEPIFVVDDVDRNGSLDPFEKIVQLDSSKYKKVVEGNDSYVRGKNLISIGKASARDASFHGTGVSSVLVGGQPRFHERVGLAPRADIIGYANNSDRGGGLGRFASQQNYLRDAIDSDVDVVVHEWTDLFSTPQDGSTNLENVMDEARRQGIVQVNPLGNMNLSKKHIERKLEPNKSLELTFHVGQGYRRGRRTYPYRRVWGALLWRTQQDPDFTLESPDGDTVVMKDDGQRKSLGKYDVVIRKQTSMRGTQHLLFAVAVSNRQDNLAEGDWKIKVSGADKTDTLIGRVVDRYSSWGVGIYWKNPTTDHGTLVYPSTADSAVGVAAYGGRHDRPRDGSGSREDELRNYSGRGPRIDGKRAVDIAAPDDPYVAFGVSTEYVERGVGRSWFRRFGGTSGAGPHVAAAAGLLKQANPTWEPDRIETRLFKTADNASLTPDKGETPNIFWGYGKVDLYEAVSDKDKALRGMPPRAALSAAQKKDEVVLDASMSTDPDSETSQLEYRFDYDYDGEWDTKWVGSPVVRLELSEYPSLSKYTARVDVRDELGNRDGDLGHLELEKFVQRDTGVGSDTGPDTGANGAKSDAGENLVWGGGDAGVSLTGNKSTGCSGCSSPGGPRPPWPLLILGLLLVVRRRR